MEKLNKKKLAVFISTVLAACLFFYFWHPPKWWYNKQARHAGQKEASRPPKPLPRPQPPLPDHPIIKLMVDSIPDVIGDSLNAVEEYGFLADSKEAKLPGAQDALWQVVQSPYYDSSRIASIILWRLTKDQRLVEQALIELEKRYRQESSTSGVAVNIVALAKEPRAIPLLKAMMNENYYSHWDYAGLLYRINQDEEALQFLARMYTGPLGSVDAIYQIKYLDKLIPGTIKRFQQVVKSQLPDHPIIKLMVDSMPVAIDENLREVEDYGFLADSKEAKLPGAQDALWQVVQGHDVYSGAASIILWRLTKDQRLVEQALVLLEKSYRHLLSTGSVAVNIVALAKEPRAIPMLKAAMKGGDYRAWDYAGLLYRINQDEEALQFLAKTYPNEETGSAEITANAMDQIKYLDKLIPGTIKRFQQVIKSQLPDHPIIKLMVDSMPVAVDKNLREVEDYGFLADSKEAKLPGAQDALWQVVQGHDVYSGAASVILWRLTKDQRLVEQALGRLEKSYRHEVKLSTSGVALNIVALAKETRAIPMLKVIIKEGYYHASDYAGLLYRINQDEEALQSLAEMYANPIFGSKVIAADAMNQIKYLDKLIPGTMKRFQEILKSQQSRRNKNP